MSWYGIHGHDQIVERFRQSLVAGRLASTFLFVGPRGVGKASFARRLAQALLCGSNPSAALEPCGACPDCRQVEAATHPDLHLIALPAEKNFIPLEMFIGDAEHRMREGLCHDIALKPVSGRRKVAIIDDADFLNREGANCLLKTLEEPPAGSVLILIGTSPQRQLATIRSRSQIVRFAPLAAESIARILQEEQLISDRAQAEDLAALSGGSLARAIELGDPEMGEFRRSLLQQLADPASSGLELAKTIGQFVDSAGKEAALRRARTRQVIDMATEFYHALMRYYAGCPPEGDRALLSAVDQAAGWWQGDDETAADCLDRCLESTRQVDSNANQATLLECWTDDLHRLALGQVLSP